MAKKAFSKPPNKTISKALGTPIRKKLPALAMEKGMGNTETGFIQRTPKTATGAMMGRAPPPLIAPAKSGTRKDAKKQFKPKGKKVF